MSGWTIYVAGSCLSLLLISCNNDVTDGMAPPNQLSTTQKCARCESGNIVVSRVRRQDRGIDCLEGLA